MRKWNPYGGYTNPGVWLSCVEAYPTMAGTYRKAPSYAALAITPPSTPGTTLNAWAGRVVDGSGYQYVGTTTKLFSSTSGAIWTDRSKGGGYNATTTNMWMFEQYGNITIATDYADAPQARDSTGSSAFADLGGTPPKARFIVVQSNAVLLFNYNDGVNTYNDGWWASDVGNHTTWTPAAGNEAANGRLLNRPGPITAAFAFKDHVIVCKSNYVFRMRYVGSPLYWVTELLAEGIGATYQGGVCVCDDVAVITGKHGASVYDGQSLRNAGEGFTTWNGTGSDLDGAGAAATGAVYVPAEGLVVFNSKYIYNIKTNAWGWTVKPFNSDGTAMPSTHVPIVGRADALNSWYSATLDNGAIAYINLSGTSGTERVVSTRPTFSGAVSTLTTEFIGSQKHMTSVAKVYPIWSFTMGYTSTMPGFNGRLNYGEDSVIAGVAPTSTAYVSSTPIAASSMRWDFLITSRYIQFEFKSASTGSDRFELADVEFVATMAGDN